MTRLYAEADRPAVLTLSVRAWAPVFASLHDVLAPSGVWPLLYPGGWEDAQRRAVAACLDGGEHRVWVAGEPVAGFVAARIHADDDLGEIHMLAVDPDAQRRGLGTALTDAALAWIGEAGVGVAMVETGGDPGHAPARRTYERAGFTALPVTRYFRAVPA